MTIPDMLRWHGRYRPRQPALVGGGVALDYRTLDATVDSLCHRLAGLGVGAGDLVGTSLSDTTGHVAILLALGRIGAVLLPLDPRWTVSERVAVASRFAAHLVLYDAGDGRAEWVRVAPDWFVPSDTAYSGAAVTDDAPMVLSLSSGTTGLPKGPRLTHRQFLNRLMVHWIDIGLGSKDRFIVATPLFFGGGRAFALAMIYAGGTAHLFPPPFEPDELIAYVAAVAGTAMFLVPTQLRRLLAEPRAELAFPTMRALISSGSALYAAEQRQVRARLTPNLYQYYASTEAGGVSLLTPDAFDAHPDTVGRPCFGVEVEIVDDRHAVLGVDAIGQLRYRSPASPDSYYKGDSAFAFRDGWFYPGDYASLDADGFLTLRGRAKDMIIRGGVNIYPADIESVLLARDDVAEAAVIGMPAGDLGEEVVAFVVRAAPVDEAVLRAACAEHLARYKVPKRFVFVAALPRNAGGKVLKDALAKMMSP